MCLISFPQHPQFNVTKQDLDDWYEWFWGKDIAERKPSPSESTLVYAERNAWREIHNKVYEGATLKDATQDLRQDSLFWTREVYERCQTRSAPQSPTKKEVQKAEEHRLVATAAPMVQGPGQIRALASQRQGEVQDKRQGQDEVIMAFLLGHCGAPFCRDFHVRKTCQGNCGRSHNCPVMKDGWVCNAPPGQHSPGNCTHK